jgi:uncharacterized membrane protein
MRHLAFGRSNAAAFCAAAVIALSGCGDESITAAFAVPAISVDVSPAALTLEQGETGTVSASIVRRGGFAGAVALAATGVPAGVAATFDPQSVTGASSTLTLEAGPSAAEGTHTITVTGSGAGVSNRSTTLTLTITAPPQVPVIDVTLGSGTLSLVQGQSGTVPVTVSSGGGFTGPVALTTAGVPNAVTATLAPASVTGTATSTLTLAAASTAVPGTYTIIVTGSGTGVASESDSLTLTIGAAPPAHSISLLIRALNNQVSVAQGESDTWEVIVTRGGGFAGPVDLSIEGLPGGVTAQFAPLTIAPGTVGSALTFTAAASAATGSTDVTIRGRATGVPDATVVVRLSVSAASP